MTLQKTAFFTALAFPLLSVVFALQVSASQLPGEVVTTPRMFPGLDSAFALRQTPTLESAIETVWGSILGNENADAALERVFDTVPILISGILPINGQDHLYLGIDRDYHNLHGSDRIYRALKKRFPSMPIYVEASDGVQLLGDDPDSPDLSDDESVSEESTEEEQTPDIIFSDTFDEGLDAWTTSSVFSFNPGWAVQHDESAGSSVAQTWECPWICNLISAEPLDLSAYESVTLSFDRWIESGISGREGFAIFIGDGDEYEALDRWTAEDGDGMWHRETYTIDTSTLSGPISLRFSATVSTIYNNDPKRMAIDNVTVTAAPLSEADTEEPETPEEPDEDQETEEMPSERPDLAVTLFIASPESVLSGGQLTFFVRITNNGTASSPEGIIRIYRHTEETETPTLGGTEEVNTTIVPAIAPSLARIRSIRNVTAPTVSETTTYYYYTCTDPVAGEENTDNNCSETPIEITVRPIATDDTEVETEEPEEVEDLAEETEVTEEVKPNLTISSLTINPTTITSGGTATISLSVTNTGGAVARSESVSLYRHQDRTETPKQGGTVAGTVRTGVITPEQTKQWSVSVDVPTVTSQTTYYYYACFESACFDQPAAITVQPKLTVLTPSLTVMGGDNMGAYYVERDIYQALGSITLGGVETADGIRGFIGSAHVVAGDEDDLLNPSLLKTNLVIIDHEHEDPRTGNIELFFLGRAFQMPRVRQRDERSVIVDAAFVAYPHPHSTGCSLTWMSPGETFCIDQNRGNHIERVAPLVVRGKGNKIYTVTGSQEPTEGLEVNHYGSTTKGVSGTVVSDRKILTRFIPRNPATKQDVYSFDYYAENKGKRSEGGDSGAPVYTNPDKDGNVNIVGILNGTFGFEDSKGFTFNSWSDVTEEFDLKPVE